jgi:hypothetical protein
MRFQEKRSVRAPLLGALGMFLGLLAVAAYAAPRVERLSPRPDSHRVPSGTSVQLSFTQPMDAVSVETRLAIEPPTAGRFVWHGERTLTFEPFQPWPPGTEVTVRLVAGARSTRFLPILRQLTWSFTIGTPRVIYLWPSQGPADLYVAGFDGEPADRLTASAFGLLDYSLTQAGGVVLYSALRPDGGADLRRIEVNGQNDELVFACPEGARCQSPRLSPQGDWAAFEVYYAGIPASPSADLSLRRVWAMSLTGGTDPYPIGPSDHVTSSPLWSPHGSLAYYDHALRAIAILDPRQGPGATPTTFIPSDLGDVGTWSPDGSFLVFPEIGFPPEALEEDHAEEEGGEAHRPIFFSHLVRAEAGSGLVVDLSGGAAGLVEDASPAYSPDGKWIAFARKSLEPGSWTLGRQLWRMRPDGSEAHALTDDPNFHHSAIQWSRDSQSLVYMRFDQTDLDAAPEIWLLDLSSGEAQPIVAGGFLPQWIP